MANHKLTPSQERGYDKFTQFYLDPHAKVMRLKGYSGTGKTTLVDRLLQDLPQFDARAKLCAPEYVPPKIVLTATTNQAAEAFALAVGYQAEVSTIHRACQLRLAVDYKTREKKLVPYGDGIFDSLVFCDEASFIDQELLRLILQQTTNCKIVFIGDPAQMTPIGTDHMPVFEMRDEHEIELTDLVRFDGGAMQELMTNLRAAVTTGVWSKMTLVGGILEHMNQEQFDNAARVLFRDPDAGQVKILAYTNDRVTRYNNMLSREMYGSIEPAPGRRMLVNEAVNNASSRCTTNEEVIVETVTEGTDYNVSGWFIKFLNKSGDYFMPRLRGSRDKAHAEAAAEDDYRAMKCILDTWIDLRPAFAQTVNKSQGSTYDVGLIDLNDICGNARTLEALARTLYVALSRFRKRIIMTGDLRRK